MDPTPQHSEYFRVFTALVVSVFIALYPYLDGSGMCGAGGCPHGIASHGVASHGASQADAGGCQCALVVVFACRAGIRARWSGRNRPSDSTPPECPYLSPEPRPPQFSLA